MIVAQSPIPYFTHFVRSFSFGSRQNAMLCGYAGPPKLLSDWLNQDRKLSFLLQFHSRMPEHLDCILETACIQYAFGICRLILAGPQLRGVCLYSEGTAGPLHIACGSTVYRCFFVDLLPIYYAGPLIIVGPLFVFLRICCGGY